MRRARYFFPISAIDADTLRRFSFFFSDVAEIDDLRLKAPRGPATARAALLFIVAARFLGYINIIFVSRIGTPHVAEIPAGAAMMPGTYRI